MWSSKYGTIGSPLITGCAEHSDRKVRSILENLINGSFFCLRDRGEQTLRHAEAHTDDGWPICNGRLYRVQQTGIRLLKEVDDNLGSRRNTTCDLDIHTHLTFRQVVIDGAVYRYIFVRRNRSSLERKKYLQIIFTVP